MIATPTAPPCKTLANNRLKASPLTTYLEPEIKKTLDDWAKEEGRSVSNLAAFLITKAVKEREESQQEDTGKEG